MWYSLNPLWPTRCNYLKISFVLGKNSVFPESVLLSPLVQALAFRNGPMILSRLLVFVDEHMGGTVWWLGGTSSPARGPHSSGRDRTLWRRSGPRGTVRAGEWWAGSGKGRARQPHGAPRTLSLTWRLSLPWDSVGETSLCGVTASASLRRPSVHLFSCSSSGSWNSLISSWLVPLLPTVQSHCDSIFISVFLPSFQCALGKKRGVPGHVELQDTYSAFRITSCE